MTRRARYGQHSEMTRVKDAIHGWGVEAAIERLARRYPWMGRDSLATFIRTERQTARKGRDADGEVRAFIYRALRSKPEMPVPVKETARRDRACLWAFAVLPCALLLTAVWMCR